MRSSLAVILIGALCVGCVQNVHSLVEKTSWNRLKPKPPQVSPDRLELHYTFLEREADDPLINEALWQEADEQAIPLDLRNQINRNGLRIGKLGARLSPELLHLLESDGPARRHSSLSGGLAKVEMTGLLSHWNLFVLEAGKPPRGEEIRNAQGYLRLTPTLVQRNHVILSIVPQVEFGPLKNRMTPAQDFSSWQFRTERDALFFANLKTELELSSGEYVLIGSWPETGSTIGNHLFERQIDGKNIRRVLLIRLVLPTRDDLYHAGYDFDDFFLTPIRKTRAIFRSTVRETVLASRRG